MRRGSSTQRSATAKYLSGFVTHFTARSEQCGHLPRGLALRRRFRLSGATSLEFRAEFFNLFNHPMFGGSSSPVLFWGRCTAEPCTGQQGPFFGKVPDQTLNEGLGGDPLFGGQSAIYAVGGPRSGQLSLKLRF